MDIFFYISWNRTIYQTMSYRINILAVALRIKHQPHNKQTNEYCFHFTIQQPKIPKNTNEYCLHFTKQYDWVLRNKRHFFLNLELKKTDFLTSGVFCKFGWLTSPWSSLTPPSANTVDSHYCQSATAVLSRYNSSHLSYTQHPGFHVFFQRLIDKTMTLPLWAEEGIMQIGCGFANRSTNVSITCPCLHHPR